MTREIIQGCKDQKAPAQQQLFTSLAPKMMTVCRRYAKTTDEAEDILQDAFVKVFTKIDTFRDQKGSFEGWVRQIVVRTAIQNWRKWHKNLTVVDDERLIENPESPSVESTMNAEDILAIINSLPEGYKVIFNLVAIEGYSHEEVGELLNISPSTSRSQLSRARQQLQKLINNSPVNTYNYA